MKTIVLKENEKFRITINNKERGWVHRLFGFRKDKPINELRVSDFRVKNAVLNCFTDHRNGCYSFEISNEIEIINNK